MEKEVSKEQHEFLEIIISNIKSLEQIKWDILPNATEFGIFPMLDKYKLTWTEIMLLGHLLIDIPLGKYIEYLTKKETENNKLIINLLENHKKLLYHYSFITRELGNIADSTCLKRMKGLDYNKINTSMISGNLLERFDILKKHDFKCVYCGRSPPEVELQLDHIHPKSKGGLDIDSNFVPACFECNNGKRDKIIDNFPKEVCNEKK